MPGSINVWIIMWATKWNRTLVYLDIKLKSSIILNRGRPASVWICTFPTNCKFLRHQHAWKKKLWVILWGSLWFASIAQLNVTGRHEDQ
jgi:hypothetical protein